MKIYVFHKDKYLDLTEAQFMVAYKEVKMFDTDQKVTAKIGDYFIDMKAEDCYWVIVGALNRQIGNM